MQWFLSPAIGGITVLRMLMVFHRFARYCVTLLVPGAEIDHLASFRAEGPETIIPARFNWLFAGWAPHRAILEYSCFNQAGSGPRLVEGIGQGPSEPPSIISNHWTAAKSLSILRAGLSKQGFIHSQFIWLKNIARLHLTIV
jgi:hypothetical protein